MWICGREWSGEVVGEIRALIARRPEMTRAELSRQVAGRLGWKDCHGRPKAMNCRVALLKLERRGVIALPAARRQIKRRAAVVAPALPPAASMVVGKLADLGELTVELVAGARKVAAREWNGWMKACHPLGLNPLCGRQLRYLVRSARHGVVAALAFSAPAWRIAARDQWIGWSDAARRANLQKVVCNSRFLIPPTVQVPHLASKALALCIRRLGADWEQRYGEPAVLLETFVDPRRHSGASYRAANWQRVGTTCGRGRNHAPEGRRRSPKDIYVLPLREDFRQLLTRQPDLGAVPAPRPRRAAADWAEQEFGGAQLGDRRLRQRLLQLARDRGARPQASIPQACGTQAKTKAAYRFLQHEGVGMEDIIKPHYAATAGRCAAQPVVLAVQDTTFLNYSTHPATEGLGPIGKQPGVIGLVLHDTMVFNLEKTPMGLIDVQCWARDPQQPDKNARDYHHLPIEQKESAKWLHSFNAAARLTQQCPHTVVVSVGDREADIYELFGLAADPAGPKLLVRACHRRLLAQEQKPLWKHLQQQPLAGKCQVIVPRSASRPQRTATLEIRFAPVQLRPPKLKPQLQPVRLWAIEARECAAPARAQAINWTLLTTLEITSLQQAVEKLNWYALRWQIEVYHRTLKSGCRIEERQLGTAARLENCLAIDLVVAWRITVLARLGREMPEVPCSIFFAEAEWKALVSFINQSFVPPSEPPSMNQAMRMVASLGGFLGRKGDGHPGTKSLWLGLLCLHTIALAWCAFSPYAKNVPVPSGDTYG